MRETIAIGTSNIFYVAKVGAENIRNFQIAVLFNTLQVVGWFKEVYSCMVKTNSLLKLSKI